MTRIRLAPEIAEYFERILEHLQTHEVADANGSMRSSMRSTCWSVTR
jgi:hypothetical protein